MKKSFKTRILLVFLLANAVGTLIFSIYSYRMQTAQIQRGNIKLLYAGAYAVAELFGNDFHDRLSDPSSVSPDQHQKNALRLYKLAQQMRVDFLYSLLNVNGKFLITAVSASPEDLAAGKFPGFWSSYDHFSPLLKQVFQSGEPGVEITADPQGRFGGSYVPYKTPQGKVYVAGAGIAGARLDQKQRELLLQCLFLGALLFFTTFALGYPLLLSLSNRLYKLDVFTNELVKNDFVLSDETRSGIDKLIEPTPDEIGNLAGSFLTLQTALESHIARLTEAVAQREKIESELKVARVIQMSMVPQNFGEINRDGLEVFASMEPAREVGGDFYDVFFLDNTRLFLTIGDVSGKGIPAALFMVMTKTLLKAGVPGRHDPAVLLEWLNEQLVKDNERAMFATLIVGILDTETGRFTFSSSGHFPPVCLRGDTPPVSLPLVPGVPVGVFPGTSYAVQEFQCKPGDALFFFTDGVTEAFNDQKEAFGDDRLIRVLQECQALPMREVITRVSQRIHEFSGPREADDDLTLLSIRYTKT